MDATRTDVTRVGFHIWHNDSLLGDERVGADALALDGVDGDAGRSAIVRSEQ